MLFPQILFLRPQTRQARNTVTEGPACEPDESELFAADASNEDVLTTGIRFAAVIAHVSKSDSCCEL